MRRLLSFVMLAVLSYTPLSAALYLRDNFSKANQGDYIVSLQSRNYSLLLISQREENRLIVEEVTVAASHISPANFSWKSWIASGAPYHTSWVVYSVELPSGALGNCFSFSKNCWFSLSEGNNFLTTLLNLSFQLVPMQQRKMIGASARKEWQPPMIIDGKKVGGVAFDAWSARWVKDGSPMSGKTIYIYVPRESDAYPSYFPYWLEVKGLVGRAKVRIVDSGKGLTSPKHLPSKMAG